MARKEQNAERKVYVTIRSAAGRRPVKLEIWRYWEIAGELQFMGLDRLEAYDAAKWCARTAKDGDKKGLSNGISMEVAKDHA